MKQKESQNTSGGGDVESAKNVKTGKKLFPVYRLEDDFHYVPCITLYTPDAELFRFLIDTGASYSFLFKSIKKGQGELAFPTGKTKVGEHLQMEFEHFGVIDFLEIDSKYNSWLREMGLHGILGMNFLEGKTLDLSTDYLYL